MLANETSRRLPALRLIGCAIGRDGRYRLGFPLGSRRVFKPGWLLRAVVGRYPHRTGLRREQAVRSAPAQAAATNDDRGAVTAACHDLVHTRVVSQVADIDHAGVGADNPQ
jgi:hypothetical protein